jgi:hypothetical protein
VDGTCDWVSRNNQLRNVALSLKAPTATSCGDFYGNLALHAGFGLQVDTGACATATGYWHTDALLPAVVATSVGAFQGPANG